MIESSVKTINYPNGEIQKVQLVTFDSWTCADYFAPDYSKGAFDQLCNIYRDFLVPKCPWIFGQMILFHAPDSFDFPFSFESRKYGKICNPQTAACLLFREGVRIVCGKPVFLNHSAETLYHSLLDLGYLRLVRGYLPETDILPVSGNMGFMSGSETDAAVKVNSLFFIMDRFDCATAYDMLGVPIGLFVKNGSVYNPPMYEREALVVHSDGRCAVEIPKLENLSVVIDGTEFRHGVNASFYSRPSRRVTPSGNVTDLVIIGRKICAVHSGGHTHIPASGFVLSCKSGRFLPGSDVSYTGYEDVLFAVQAGNSAVVNGQKTTGFVSPFYNIRRPYRVPFPPSLYPLDYCGALAPRIAIGADINNRPMLLWAEGAGKTGYTPGIDSRGASLMDMADICVDVGMYNAVNLDGGGSAQILVSNRRSLLISDRNTADNSEAERAVPAGIMIRSVI